MKQNFHNNNWSTKLNKGTILSTKEELNEANSSIAKLLPQIKNVLDVGCGTGELMFFLNKNGITTKGIDVSSVAVKEAKKKGLDAIIGDLDSELPFKDKSFDCVICTQVLMHTLDPEFVIKEMARVSKKYVLINVPNHLYWRFRIAFIRGKFPDVLKGRFAHTRVFNLKKIQDQISLGGLKIIKRDFTGKKFLPSLFATGFTFLCEK